MIHEWLQTHPWLMSQAILSAFGSLAVVLLLCRYRANVSRIARRQSYQYRIFALRDAAIRLVVEGKVAEDDEHWLTLYRFLNETAKAVTVDKVTSIRFFPWFFAQLIQHLPKPPSDARTVKKAPKAVRDLWKSSAESIVAILWDGNRWFRWLITTMVRATLIYKLVSRTIPDIFERYMALNRVATLDRRNAVVVH